MERKDETIKRPLGVWLAQSLMIAVGLFLTLILYSIFRDFLSPEQSHQENEPYFVLFFTGFLTLVIASFYTLAKRKLIGKWFSISVFIIIFGLILDSQLTPSDYIRGGLYQVIPIGVQFLALGLIFNFIYSTNVKRFLGEEIKDKVSKLWKTNG
jgi:hypothetical protein